MTTIALVDDHVLLRKGLSGLLKDLDYSVTIEADNGKDFIEKLKTANLPNIVLLDINMPLMDGYETALWLKRNHPEVKILALSMYDDENAIIRMLRSGARGYILKDSEPSDLKQAIQSLMTKGVYLSELVSGTIIHSINNLEEPENSSLKELLGLNEREIEFLKLACTEMTYKEIADKMIVSPRTVDSYRDNLFEKLNVRSRVGLVLFAIRNGIVKIQ